LDHLIRDVRWPGTEELSLDSPDDEREIKFTVVGTDIIERADGSRRGDYYLRVVQRDGAMAWSSPVWIEGRNT